MTAAEPVPSTPAARTPLHTIPLHTIPLHTINVPRFHRAQFGLLCDPVTGLPDRGRGRQFNVLSADHPKGCFPVLTPLRIAENVSAIPYHVDESANPAGALVATPVYHSGSDLGHGAWLALTRIHPGRPAAIDQIVGDNAYSTSLLIGWEQYVNCCTDLAACLPEQQTDSVNTLSDMGRRLSASAFRMGNSSEPSNSPLAVAIMGAVAAGMGMRLDKRHAGNEQVFLDAMSYALAHLPATCRPHISFSAGWCWPDDDVQIAWSPNMGGLLTGEREFQALQQIGSTPITIGQTAPFIPPLPQSSFVYLGRVMPCWRNPGLHHQIRMSLSRHLQQSCGLDAGAMKNSLDTRLASQRIVRLQRAFEIESANIFPIAFDGRSQKDRKGWETALVDWLAGFVCLNLEQLQLIAGNETARRAVAATLRDGRRDIQHPFERSFYLVAEQIGACHPDLHWLCGAFLPTDSHLFTDWGDFRTLAGPFNGALKDLAKNPLSMSPDTIRRLVLILCRQEKRQAATGALIAMTRTVADDRKINCTAWLNAVAAIVTALQEDAATKEPGATNVVKLTR